jgi:putative endonuclease
VSKPPPKDAKRESAHRFGLRAETLAAVWLTLKGYRILARRFKASGGEIDLVVWRRGVVAFVEVKARPSLDEALSSIAFQKRRRISRAARAWLSRNPWAAARTLRGDAVYVAPWRWPRHVVAAVELEM